MKTSSTSHGHLPFIAPHLRHSSHALQRFSPVRPPLETAYIENQSTSPRNNPAAAGYFAEAPKANGAPACGQENAKGWGTEL
jgi:hypothetical protein